jgi:alpha-1,2-mannosyltransferase
MIPRSGTNQHLPRHRGWLILAGIGIVYTLVIAVVVAVRAESSSDFRDFWENAVHFRETGEVAADLGVHNYLPFFTIFMLPWGLLPLRIAIVVFAVLSLVLFAITVMLAESLLNDRVRSGPRVALVMAIVLVCPYVHSGAVLGNVGVLVLFLIVTAWFLVERGREWEAGVALGLATLIKLLPGLLILFFLLKRRWRLAGAAAATTVVLGLGLPALTVGWKQTVALHQDFYLRAWRGGSAIEAITSDKPGKAMYSNNAVPIVLRRLFSPVDGARGDQQGLYVDFVDLSHRAILGIYVALMAVFLGTSIALPLYYPNSWPPEGVAAGRAVRAQFGLWCCVMLLASPLVWTHYLPLAYWPLASLADRVERTYRAGQTCRVSAAALGLWLIGALLLVWPAARAAGAQIASVAVVWLALVILSLRPDRRFAG